MAEDIFGIQNTVDTTLYYFFWYAKTWQTQTSALVRDKAVHADIDIYQNEFYLAYILEDVSAAVVKYVSTGEAEAVGAVAWTELDEVLDDLKLSALDCGPIKFSSRKLYLD